MASDYEEFGAMLERAGIDQQVEAFEHSNEIQLYDSRVVFVFANSGALIAVNL